MFDRTRFRVITIGHKRLRISMSNIWLWFRYVRFGDTRTHEAAKRKPLFEQFGLLRYRKPCEFARCGTIVLSILQLHIELGRSYQSGSFVLKKQKLIVYGYTTTFPVWLSKTIFHKHLIGPAFNRRRYYSNRKRCRSSKPRYVRLVR